MAVRWKYPNVGNRMMEGQYYLLGPDGEMVMPQVWETMVKPEWHVTMPVMARTGAK